MSIEDRKKGWEARAAAVRRAEERKAAHLESRGWVCYPPEEAEFVRTAVAIVTPEGDGT